MQMSPLRSQRLPRAWGRRCSRATHPATHAAVRNRGTLVRLRLGCRLEGNPFTEYWWLSLLWRCRQAGFPVRLFMSQHDAGTRPAFAIVAMIGSAASSAAGRSAYILAAHAWRQSRDVGIRSPRGGGYDTRTVREYQRGRL